MINPYAEVEEQSLSVKDLLGTLLLRGIDINGDSLGDMLSEKLNNYQALLGNTPKGWGKALGYLLLKDED